MYVRKFEADSLDEALKAIKRELGPDAIILKTVTNKGLKGAFKKNRVEITAAISEKNYTKKARVDHTLQDDQRDKFYQNDSRYISQMIDGYSGNRDESQVPQGNGGNYTNLGLNKQVQSLKDMGSRVRNSLDDFLSGDAQDHFDGNEGLALGQRPEVLNIPSGATQQVRQEEVYVAPVQEQRREAPQAQAGLNNEAQEVIQDQRRKIDALEKKLYELTKSVERIDKREPEGIFQLRTTLRSLSIAEHTVNELLRKAMFELKESELQDPDVVFEFTLREMLERVPTAMPKFSNLDGSETPFLTVLVSDNSCGQTSMLYKLGALRKGSVLVQYQPGKSKTFTETMFDLQVEKVTTIPDIISCIRKATSEGKSVFVDYRNSNTELNDTKKFIDGLRRSFGNVEVMICLSAIHSEIYNRKVVSTYQELAEGLIITNLDLCLNYGALFNICEEYPGLPLKFFGTGDVIPDDIEAATGERILAGMFKLN